MAGMAGVVDTSFLFTVLHEEADGREDAVATLHKYLGVEIPPAVLAELEILVRKRMGLAFARQMIPDFLRRNPHVGVMDADLHPDALAIWQRHGRLSYTDCHAIAGALLLGDDLITLDRRQEAVWKEERKREV